MSFKISIQSECFTQENGAWISEGIVKSTLPCRFLYRKNGSFSLSYDEKTDDFAASSRMTYEQEAQTLTLFRTGDTRYTAIFGREPCSFVYAVSSFAFDACVNTESLAVKVNEKGGSIALSYILTLSDIPRRITLSCVIL